jgi:signal transduction histidine kinase
VRERRRRQEEHLAFAGVLANGIVHDFRNPMSSMRLDLQMLAKETGKGAAVRLERVRELADRLRGTIDRMDKVFREFLYMSKPGPAELDALDLRDCLADCIDLVRPRLEQADVTVDLAGPAEPVPVLASASALSRAIVNVLTNAIQFSPRGGCIRVDLAREARSARIDIRDEGPGIEPGDHERVFEMFASTRPEGTGLGLFLARTAIEKCGGGIAVVAAGRPGACIRITLPIDNGALHDGE